MNKCALPGCDLPARSDRPNSCCCHKHRLKFFRLTHKVVVTEVRQCACGCGESFECSPRSRRLYVNNTHVSRARNRRPGARERWREQYAISHPPKPKAPKVAKPRKPKQPRVVSCRVDKPAPAQTHTRLKPKSHNATALDERMDKVVRDAWQSGDKYQREQIEALNKNMVFA